MLKVNVTWRNKNGVDITQVFNFPTDTSSEQIEAFLESLKDITLNHFTSYVTFTPVT